MSAAAPSVPDRNAPLALWRVAEVFLRTLHMLFGGPEDVAARHTLTAKAHAHMASWLRSAEAMLRRLLLIEASFYPKPNTRPLLHPRRPRTRKLMSFEAEKPEAWRVSFRCFDLPPRRGASAARREAKGDAPSGASGVISPVNGGDKCSEPVFVFRENRVPRAKTRVRFRRRGRAAASTRTRLLRQDRLWVQHEPKARFRSAWPLAERYEALIRVFNDPAAYARRLARRLHARPHRLAEALRAPPEARERVDRFDESGERAKDAWRPHFSSA